MKVKEDKGEWWLTGVYGPNSSHKRSEFWDELAGLSEICGPRWCVGGDFNVVRFTHEKFPQGRAKRGMRCFEAFIQESELWDINFAKGKFTWSNFRETLQKASSIDSCFLGDGRSFFN